MSAITSSAQFNFSNRSEIDTFEITSYVTHQSKTANLNERSSCVLVFFSLVPEGRILVIRAKILRHSTLGKSLLEKKMTFV